jgi:hypothetical protein
MVFPPWWVSILLRCNLLARKSARFISKIEQNLN